jgi:TP901 family phage tail tape measure protein
VIVAELAATLGLIPDDASWDKGHELIHSLGNALEAYLGYEGLKKVGELVSSTVEAAQEAKNLGEELGITAEAVQQLGYAAYVSDVSVEQFNSAMFRFSRGMEQAKKGTGPVHDALGKLKIKMQDLKGETLDQNLEVLADAFKNAGPEVNKTAIAIDLFGRGAGPRMQLLLNKGKEGLVDLRNEASKLGFVMGEDALRAAEEFEAAQKRLHATLIGVRNEAVTAVLPALTEMGNALGEWVKENREAIRTGLQAVLEGVAFAFKLVGGAIGFVISFLDEHREVLAALIVIAGVFIGEMIIGAAGVALGWALALAPLILLAAAVTGMIHLVKALVEYVLGTEVTWSEMWDGVVAAGEAVLDWFEAFPEKALGWIESVGSTIREAFGAAFDWVVKKAHAVWEDIKGFFGDFLNLGTDSVIDQATKLGKQQNPSATGGGFVTNLSDNLQRAPDVTATFGDTHIQIDAANMSPEDLEKHVKDGVREAHQDFVREAYANLTGGKR